MTVPARSTCVGGAQRFAGCGLRGTGRRAISAPKPLEIVSGEPMQVDEKTVRRIARLARIKVTDAEAKNLEGELSGILDWVKQLDEVDTKGVEPLTSVVAMQMKKRKDDVTDGGAAADVTKNAPMSEDDFYVVPKVVE
jgi:aspartyl-tRNA(Asn)/glutamyl-tRNA(Gln) amidotransferase subunit C